MLQRPRSDATATWLTRQIELWDALFGWLLSTKHKDINAYLHGSVASHKDIQARCFLQDRRMSVAHSCCGNSACRPCRGHSQGGDDVKKRLHSGIAKDCNIVQ